MGPGRRRMTVAAIALMSVALVPIAAGTGSAGSQAEKDGVVGSARVNRAAQERVMEYWTPTRMKNAIEMKVAVPAEAPSATISDDQPSGDAVSIPGTTPAGRTDPEAEDPSSVVQESPTPVGYTYPFPFTRHAVDGSYLRGNYRTIGKMFFTQGGSNFVCSGASVVSSPNNVVYTAGHCVSNGAGAFSTNVVFVPARQNGVNPYGTFAGGQLWTTSDWHFNGDLTRDLAAFTVGLNAANETLQSRVGALGFQYNQSRVRHWDDFGYPAASPFAGELMITCKASHAVDDTGIPGAGPDPMGIGCDMTGGSSGGPWIAMLGRGSFLNSVNSYKYPSTQPAAMYGPYFDLLADQVRCAAATSGGPSPC